MRMWTEKDNFYTEKLDEIIYLLNEILKQVSKDKSDD